MKSRSLAFLASFCLGFGVWALSRTVTGQAEPWDATFPFYLITFLIGGGIISLITGHHHILCWVGVWIGQVAALLILSGLDRSWIVLGVITTAAGSIIAVLGSIFTEIIRGRMNKHSGASRN